MKTKQINWKEVWKAFDRWAYAGNGAASSDALTETGKKLISSAVTKQLKAK